MSCNHPFDRLMESVDYKGKLFCRDCEKRFEFNAISNCFVEWLPKDEPAREAKEEFHKAQPEYLKDLPTITMPCQCYAEQAHLGYGCLCSCHKPQNTDCSEDECKCLFKCTCGKRCQDKKQGCLSETHTVDGTPDMSYVTESPFRKQEEPEREDKGHSKRFIDALSHQVDLIENKLQDQEEFVDAMSRQVDKNINRLDKMDSEEKEFRKDILDYLELPNLGNRGEHLSYNELCAKQYALRKKYT